MVIIFESSFECKREREVGERKTRGDRTRKRRERGRDRERERERERERSP